MLSRRAVRGPQGRYSIYAADPEKNNTVRATRKLHGVAI
jgi:hypothetical protein